MARAKGPQPFRFRWEQAFRADRELAGTSKHVGLTLATYADGDGRGARPGQARLAADTGLKDRAVRHHLAVLEEAKWIIKHSAEPVDNSGRGRPATVYSLAIPGDLYRHRPAGKSPVDARVSG